MEKELLERFDAVESALLTPLRRCFAPHERMAFERVAAKKVQHLTDSDRAVVDQMYIKLTTLQ